MRILMLSWEFPPHVIGGISTHVAGLSHALARAGHDVVISTMRPDGTGDDDIDEMVHGVRVLRADHSLPWLPSDDLVTSMVSANHQLIRICSKLGEWRPDVVHAHDWMTAWAGDTLSALWNVPLVATMHGTERGRHGGHLPPGMPGTVNSVEWWLTYRAKAVIACSRFMTREVVDCFDPTPDKVHLVPNGVDTTRWSAARTAHAREPEGQGSPLVVAWGRVQYEKGFQVLVRAMGELRSRLPGVRCVIAGRGTYLPELQALVDIEGVADLVQLPGFVPDDELRRLVTNARCVVIPSLYEPFGIVALEGMAAGAPTIVARTGGLAEIVNGTGAGAMFEPGNHHELADTIEATVNDTARAADMRVAADRLVERTYSWDAVADATLGVYRRTLA